MILRFYSICHYFSHDLLVTIDLPGNANLFAPPTVQTTESSKTKQSDWPSAISVKTEIADGRFQGFTRHAVRVALNEVERGDGRPVIKQVDLRPFTWIFPIKRTFLQRFRYNIPGSPLKFEICKRQEKKIPHGKEYQSAEQYAGWQCQVKSLTSSIIPNPYVTLTLEWH